MPIICLLSAGAGKHHGGLPVYTLIPSAPAWGLTLSGIGPWALVWAVKSSPATLRGWPSLPPGPTPLTFWSSQLSPVFQGDNTDPGDLLEVGPRGGGTNSCLGQCQLPPSQGVLQTRAKQGHAIATSGSRGRAVRSRVPKGLALAHRLLGNQSPNALQPS